MLSSTESSVIYWVALINAKGIKYCDHLDTGLWNASEAIVNLLKINLIRKEYNTMETLTNDTTRKLKIYSAKIQDLNNKFTFAKELNKLKKEVLLTLPNLKYN